MLIETEREGSSLPLQSNLELPARFAEPRPERGPEQASTSVPAGTGTGVVPAAPGTGVIDRVRAWASRHPSAPAVVAGGRIVRYGALDSRANGLAAELRELGVGPEVLVGLRADRSAEAVLGQLAILKAGGAWLPIDPCWPEARAAQVLADARCRLQLATGALAEAAVRAGGRVVTLELEGEQAPEPPEVEQEPEQLAYVIYTSGSSGRPKGVEVTRGNLANLVAWHQHAFAVQPHDRATLIASPGFDAAVWELWPNLAAGACLYVPEGRLRTDPPALRDWLLEREITIAFLPTALAERMLLLEWPGEAPLRLLLTGGEALHRYPPPGLPFTLVNNYGPTECTVVATSGEVAPVGPAEKRPSIGRPIDRCRVQILDEQLVPVAFGQAGELCLGGASLARGYLHDPTLTAERFIADPLDSRPGARLYRTGDRARRLHDGTLEFLGRVDDQVKVRGVRIEPDEIVAALDQLPEIAESAVVARELESGDRQLVAYLVLREAARPTQAALRSALLAQLPEHLVPGCFVLLDELPLGPTGKVDRQALPPPGAANTLRDQAWAEPRTTVEKAVAQLVAELVGAERVGRDDNFFLLGGHSLMGTQLIGRLAAQFGVELTLRTIFDAASVAQIAAEVERLLLARLRPSAGAGLRQLLSGAGRAVSRHV
jgi:amino acid adenylation domain-containing protein